MAAGGNNSSYVSSGLKRSNLIAVGLILMLAELVWIVQTTLNNDCGGDGGEGMLDGAIPYEKIRRQAAMDSQSFSQQPNLSFQRYFRQWDYDEHPFPCFPVEKQWRVVQVMRSPARTGLLFIRNMKTGSSTLGGIAIRIARAMKRKAPTPLDAEMCRVRYDHTRAVDLKFGERKFNQSYLFSFIRDPNKRAISEFFHFGVSRFKQEPNDANFQKYFRDRWFLDNYFLWDMALHGYQPGNNKTAAVESIMQGYDFIGLTERMDESLVVLKMLLGLELNDVLYLASSKGNGGFDDGAYMGKCHYIIPKHITPGMKEWMASDEWKKRIDGDYMLYQAANRSLEMTIEKLGREEVYRQLHEFQRLKKLAVDKCTATTIFPCTPDGNLHRFNHSCLWWDLGCGYKCLDSLREDYDPNEEEEEPEDPLAKIDFSQLSKLKLSTAGAT